MKQKSYTSPDTWLRRYNIAANNQDKLFKKFAAYYDIANTVYPSDRKVAPWRSKMLFPSLGNKAWQLAAKFIGLKPGWAVQAKLPPITDDMPKETLDELVQQMRDKEERAQYKLDFDYDNPEMDDSMRNKLLAVMMDAIITGTGVGKAPWVTKTREHKERMAGPDGMVDMTQEKVTTKTIGLNEFIPVNIFNVFIAPAATSLYSSPWVIIAEHKTLAQLKSTNEANGGKFYQNLDMLEEVGAKSDRFAQYKASRNRLMVEQDVITADKTVEFIPLFECYDLDNHSICLYASVGNGKDTAWIPLREERDVYWHGKYPLLAFYIKKKPHDFWGQGIFQTNERVDAAKNDLFNHYMDNLNLSIDGGVLRPENTIVNPFRVSPGFDISYKGSVAPTQWKFPEPNPAQLNVISQLLDRSLEDGTISPYAAGTPNSATDTTAGTKGGILALQQEANDILSFGRANFRESVTQLGKFFLSNNQQFMDEPLTILTKGPQGDKPLTISPMDLQGELILEVTEDSMEPLSPEQVRNNFEQSLAGILSLQKGSIEQANLYGTKPVVVDFNALAEETAQQYGQKTFKRFIMEDDAVEALLQEQAQKAMAAQQANLGDLKTQPKQPSESLNYKDAPPDIRRQIEQQAGLSPSQMEPQNAADVQVQQMTSDLISQGHLDPNQLQEPPQ